MIPHSQGVKSVMMPEEAKLTYPFEHPQGIIMSKPVAIGKRVYKGTNIDK